MDYTNGTLTHAAFINSQTKDQPSYWSVLKFRDYTKQYLLEFVKVLIDCGD